MSDDPRGTLERIAGRVPVPQPAYDRLFRRKDHKQRVRRVSAGVLAIVICAAAVSVLLHGFGGAEQPLTPTPALDCHFSALGGWIAYGFDRSRQGPVGIWAVDPQHPDDTCRLSTRGGQPLAWSSDGRKLLIGSNMDQTWPSRANLWILGANGSATTVVTADAHHMTDGGSLSPDGSRVVYAYSNQDSGGIFEVDANSGTPRLLLAGDVNRPAFSPDGSTIAFVQGGDFDNTLRLMDADGGNVRVLLPYSAMRDTVIGGLAWSPDGSKLAFGTGNDKIWVVNADGTGLRQLITQARFPSWSPDGTQIAFAFRGAFGVEGLAIGDSEGKHFSGIPSAGPGPWNPLPRSSTPPSGVATS